MDKTKIFESDNLKIYHTVLGLLSNNVYLIKSGDETALVDPSCRPDDVINFVGETLDKILITHYHFDHIGAACQVKSETGAKTYASAVERGYIEQTTDIPGFHRKVDPCTVDVEIHDGDTISIGNTEWKVIETPGHSMGSVCYYCESEKVLFSGDTLFYGSCGRVDFVDSDPKAMLTSLQKLAKLSVDVKVFPGHSQFTTIGDEIDFINEVNL